MNDINTIQVLLVDDDDEQLFILKHILEKIITSHYKIRAVESYDSGLQAILNETYDVCLVDYNLGSDDGLKLIKDAIKKGSHLPFVLMTGQGSESLDKLAMKAGAMDYMMKEDVSAPLLERTIRYAIEHKKAMNQLKKAIQENKKLAEYDMLTGLGNRNLFHKISKFVFSDDMHNKNKVLMFLDLDDFKDVNDRLGHDFGDEVLVNIARRFEEVLSDKKCYLFRFGGDEFTVIVDLAKQDAYQVALIAQSLLDSLSVPLEIGNEKILLSASIGIATTWRCGFDLNTLLKAADTAMYHAKNHGRNNYKFFTIGLNQDVVNRVQLNQQLKDALDNEHFVLHYQPFVELKTRKIVGVEALIRLQLPHVDQLMMPDEFIPALEASKLIQPVGCWVARMAAQQLNRWAQDSQIDSNLKMTINVSSIQLEKDDFTTYILNEIERNHIAPGHLVVELTENTIMQNQKRLTGLLKQLDDDGVSIFIDDFGVGYSSLSHLKNLPICLIKIDISFIRDLASDASNAIIVKAIIGLAHSLGMDVVAEGIETKEQFDFLLKHDCDYGQGYYFSKAQPEKKITHFLRKGLVEF